MSLARTQYLLDPPEGIVPRSPIVPIKEETFGTDDPEVQQGKLSGVVKRVLQEKETLKDKALANKWDRYNPFIIGGDAFTMATLAFDGVQTLMPQVSNIAAVAALTMVCGLVAGVINVGVGAVCFKESMQAFYNGDKLLGFRLLLDSVTLTAIGIVMILAALSAKVTALGAVGAFFKASPWVLPVLFFIISIPVIVEIARRIKNIHTGNDMASKLNLKKIEVILEQGDVVKACNHLMKKLNIKSLPDLVEENPREVFKKLTNTMEELQADMGAEAALAVFKLLLKLREQNLEASLEALEKAKEEIKSWNRVQHIRMFQQILYLLAFIASLGVLSPTMSSSTGAAITATQQFTMSAANAIPLYMDSMMPFKRNPPIVVPMVDVPGEEEQKAEEEIESKSSKIQPIETETWEAYLERSRRLL
jgi:hypothetical protein